MKPLRRFSVTNSSSALCSASEREYIGPNGGTLPSSSSILWSKERCGGSERDLDSLKTSANSWYSGGSLVRSEGSSSSGNAARAAGDGSETSGDRKRMHVGGKAAFRVASSKAAAPTSATWIGFSETGEGEGEGEDEGEGV